MIAILLITLLGLGLRVFTLTAGTLWLDEGYVVIQSNTPIMELVRNAAQDGNTFFSIWLVKTWATLFGKSEWAYESLACVFGFLAIPLMAVLARELFDRKAGWVSASVLAISLFHVLYSQQMRIYAFAIFVSLAAATALARFVRTRTRASLIAFSAATWFFLNSHAYAIFIVSAFFVYLLICFRKEGSVLKRVLTAGVVVGILFLPALYCMLYQYLVLYRFDWIPKPTGEAVSLAFIRMSSNSGALLFLFPLLIAYALFMAYREKVGRRCLLLVLWFLVPLVSTVILSLLGRSFFQYSYMVLILPPYLLLVSFGVSRLPGSWLRVLVVIGIALLSVGPLQEYYEGRLASGGDKELYLYIRDHHEPGDVILHNSRHSFVPSLFYHDYAFDEYFLEDIRSWHGFAYYGYRKKPQIGVGELEGYRRVWIVTHEAEYNQNLRAVLNDPRFLRLNPRLIYTSPRKRLLLFDLT